MEWGLYNNINSSTLCKNLRDFKVMFTKFCPSLEKQFLPRVKYNNFITTLAHIQKFFFTVNCAIGEVIYCSYYRRTLSIDYVCALCKKTVFTFLDLRILHYTHRLYAYIYLFMFNVEEELFIYPFQPRKTS